jgi:hypothetical protein
MWIINITYNKQSRITCQAFDKNDKDKSILVKLYNIIAWFM